MNIRYAVIIEQQLHGKPRYAARREVEIDLVIGTDIVRQQFVARRHWKPFAEVCSVQRIADFLQAAMPGDDLCEIDQLTAVEVPVGDPTVLGGIENGLDLRKRQNPRLLRISRCSRKKTRQ
jgi:hypothetical protein